MYEEKCQLLHGYMDHLRAENMDRDITEKQFEAQIKDLAKLFGWKYYHTWRSIHSPAGFPDCVMVRNGQLIFAELKSEKGKLTPEQDEWLDALIGVAKHTNFQEIQVYLWRPHMIEEIVKILR